MQTNVRAQFALVADEVLTRHGDGRWEVVDATGSIDEIAGKIWDYVEPVISEELGDVMTLWS